jgi:hypothetical protein
MNVFVLSTGRAGSASFVRACSHVENYSAAHESRVNIVGSERLKYPPNHIEADNRLAWFLGRLEEEYGDHGFYIHLTRDRNATANSFLRRFGTGIINAYAQSIIWKAAKSANPIDVCLDYVDTVNQNIHFFLQTKSNKMSISLENIDADFPVFWKAIGAFGDLKAALSEWNRPYNSSDEARFLQKLQSAIAIARWNLKI